MLIKELFDDIILENTKYEFKSKIEKDNPLKWGKTLVGFANKEGGTIFIGVSNDGVAFGLSLKEIDEYKNLINVVNDRYIIPHIKYKFEIRSIDDEAEKFVLCIKVLKSQSIVRWKSGDFNEVVYLREDGNTIAATPEEIITLHRKKFGVDSAITDIKYNSENWKNYINLCMEYRNDGASPTLKELQSAGLVDVNENVTSGFLMFQDGYVDDYVTIVCRLWKGLNKVGILLDKTEFRGSLGEGFLFALNYLEKNTNTGYVKTVEGGHEDIRSYPKLALREAIVNAIAHRDYSIHGAQIDIDIYNDRIDITSPGAWLLPYEYEKYEVGTIPSIKRNEIIAKCFMVANLMEGNGSGFLTISEEYKKASDEKQPVVLSYNGYFILRLFDLLYERKKDKNLLLDLTQDQKTIIEALKEEAKTATELQKLTGYNSRDKFNKYVINPLIELELIFRDGKEKSPSAKYKIK